MIITDFAAFGGILFAVLYMVVMGIKRLIIYPRIGHVKFLNARRRLTKNMAVGLAVFIFLTLLTIYLLFLTREGIRPAFLTWLNNYFTEPSLLIMAVVLVIIISVFAYIYRINRWYAYAVLILLGVSSYQWLGFSLPVQLHYSRECNNSFRPGYTHPIPA